MCGESLNLNAVFIESPTYYLLLEQNKNHFNQTTRI